MAGKFEETGENVEVPKQQENLEAENIQQIGKEERVHGVGAGGEKESMEPGVVNSDRRLVLVGDPPNMSGDEEEEEDDDEFVFEEDEKAVQDTMKWMAIARYYSGQEFKTWVLFNELSKVWGRSLEVPGEVTGSAGA